MKEVTKGDFYAYVGPRDICVYAKGDFNESDTVEFKTRGGRLVGRSEGKQRGRRIETRYFLVANL